LPKEPSIVQLRVSGVSILPKRTQFPEQFASNFG
jgi:hypothetical protein